MQNHGFYFMKNILEYHMVDAGLTKDTIAIATLNYEDAEETFNLVKKYDLRMSPTFYFPYPVKDDKYIPLESWTKEDWDNVKKAEEDFFDLF